MLNEITVREKCESASADLLMCDALQPVPKMKQKAAQQDKQKCFQTVKKL